MNTEILLPDGVTVGHADNGVTGVTCILAGGATGGVSVRGGAPGTRETDLLRPEKSQSHIDAIVLSGGSAYGLDASVGVMEYLRDKNIGFAAGDKVVPLVAQAVLFDLNTPGQYIYPDRAMGRLAAENATSTPCFGNVGAGRGATVGKLFGMQLASKSGIGAATVRFNDVFVTAIIAVNALGDVYDHRTGKVISGAHTPDGRLADVAARLTDGSFAAIMAAQMQASAGTNTTIGCVMTNAALDKTATNKLAAVAHDGLAMSIRPVHTDADGDTMFALSKGDKVIDYSIVAALAAEASALAIENAVKL